MRMWRMWGIVRIVARFARFSSLATVPASWRTDEHDAMYASETVLWWYVGLREYILDWLGLLALPPTGPRPVYVMLDAGCGTGGMLARLAPYGTAVGVDLAAHAVRVTRDRRGCPNVAQASLTAIPAAADTFDIAVSLDVISDAGVAIEAAALDELYRVLKPGGRLVLNLPAFASLAGEHDVAVRTARRYTASEARALVERHGFAVERWSYWNMALTPAVWAARHLSRRKPLDADSAHSDITPPATPVNRALLGLIRLERRLLHRVPRLPFGSSLLVLARKPRVATRAPLPATDALAAAADGGQRSESRARASSSQSSRK